MTTAIIITLMVACSCAAFYYGKQVGYTERNAQLSEEKRRDTEDALTQLMAEYKQLEFAMEAEQKEKHRPTQPTNGWETFEQRRG